MPRVLQFVNDQATGAVGVEKSRLSDRAAALGIAALMLVGATLRLIVAGQSLFADELSTYWVVIEHGFGGMLSTINGDAEITPPLYFIASWLTTRLGVTPELLRAPSLVAGIATIPLIYLVGCRTVGRTAALLAATLTTLSPFAIYYSAEARGYALMIAFVVGSTLAMLLAVDRGERRWWVVYAVCICAAMYSQYTAIFALGAQFLWLLWAHPPARRDVLLATGVAVIGFLPWTTGLLNDINSPTTDVLNYLSQTDARLVRIELAHWVIGYPQLLPHTGLRAVPGVPALVALVAGVAVALIGVAVRAFRTPGPITATFRIDRRWVLVGALLISAPAGELLYGAVGTNLFSVRDIGVSWPALALALGGIVAAAGQPLRAVSAGLLVICFALAASRMLEPRVQRPDYAGAAAFVDRTARPGDAIVDATSISPAPLTGFDAAYHGRLPVFHASKPAVPGANPFSAAGRPQPALMASRAAAAAPHGRIFVITGEPPEAQPAGMNVTPIVTETLRRSYPRATAKVLDGTIHIVVLELAPR